MKVFPTIILVIGVLLLVMGLGYLFTLAQGPAPTKAMPVAGIHNPAPPAPAVVLVKAEPPAPDSITTKSSDNLRPSKSESSRKLKRQAVEPGPVVFFEHGRRAEQFPGRSWPVPLGLTSDDALLAQDQASSLEIPAGLQAVLFEDEEGSGHRLQLGPGFHNLAPYGFDDIVSSVRVAPLGQDALAWRGPSDAVELYEHRESHLGDRGVSWKLALPASRNHFLFVCGPNTFSNNTVSAVWVPQGLELSLFDQADGLGAAMVLGPGYHELDFVDFNDRTSSVRVRLVR